MKKLFFIILLLPTISYAQAWDTGGLHVVRPSNADGQFIVPSDTTLPFNIGIKADPLNYSNGANSVQYWHRPITSGNNYFVLSTNSTGLNALILATDLDGSSTQVGIRNLSSGLRMWVGTSQNAYYIDLNTIGLSTFGNVNAGKLIGSTPTAVTCAAAATTFAVASSSVVVTGDGSGNTIATITGGVAGATVRLLFVDGLVTITDTDAHTANTVDLSAAFTSADDTILTLYYDGTSWYEISRSVN